MTDPLTDLLGERAREVVGDLELDMPSADRRSTEAPDDPRNDSLRGRGSPQQTGHRPPGWSLVAVAAAVVATVAGGLWLAMPGDQDEVVVSSGEGSAAESAADTVQAAIDGTLATSWVGEERILGSSDPTVVVVYHPPEAGTPGSDATIAVTTNDGGSSVEVVYTPDGAVLSRCSDEPPPCSTGLWAETRTMADVFPTGLQALDASTAKETDTSGTYLVMDAAPGRLAGQSDGQAASTREAMVQIEGGVVRRIEVPAAIDPVSGQAAPSTYSFSYTRFGEAPPVSVPSPAEVVDTNDMSGS